MRPSTSTAEPIAAASATAPTRAAQRASTDAPPTCTSATVELCTCYAHAMHAHAMHMLRRRYVHAHTHSIHVLHNVPCTGYARAMHGPCTGHAYAHLCELNGRVHRHKLGLAPLRRCRRGPRRCSGRACTRALRHEKRGAGAGRRTRGGRSQHDPKQLSAPGGVGSKAVSGVGWAALARGKLATPAGHARCFH